MSQGVKEQTAYGTSDRQQGGQEHCRQKDLKGSHGGFYATLLGRGLMGKGDRRESEEEAE